MCDFSFQSQSPFTLLHIEWPFVLTTQKNLGFYLSDSNLSHELSIHLFALWVTFQGWISNPKIISQKVVAFGKTYQSIFQKGPLGTHFRLKIEHKVL